MQQAHSYVPRVLNDPRRRVQIILAQDDEGHITKAAVKRLKKNRKRAKVGYHSVFKFYSQGQLALISSIHPAADLCVEAELLVMIQDDCVQLKTTLKVLTIFIGFSE